MFTEAKELEDCREEFNALLGVLVSDPTPENAKPFKEFVDDLFQHFKETIEDARYEEKRADEAEENLDDTREELEKAENERDEAFEQAGYAEEVKDQIESIGILDILPTSLNIIQADKLKTFIETEL